ncbi:STAS domain-containing protein [Streptomyces sp. PTM05]|uniref:Anti-sigma factor antagonist n=1 Tax=Streptantibioticus parmotrematis TaxID=2873249 RepID=A0ABS7QVE6_9ACTN|nr:STAS domain-containing protein [Streptantibioticus parmotrematis]MBY8886639.1 STAS domain-containing protein [Streptantibioticus parmotrematis]
MERLTKDGLDQLTAVLTARIGDPRVVPATTGGYSLRHTVAHAIRGVEAYLDLATEEPAHPHLARSRAQAEELWAVLERATALLAHTPTPPTAPTAPTPPTAPTAPTTLAAPTRPKALARPKPPTRPAAPAASVPASAATPAERAIGGRSTIPAPASAHEAHDDRPGERKDRPMTRVSPSPIDPSSRATLTIARIGSVLVLRLAGELDLASTTILDEASATEASALVFDLSRLDFCDSTGLNILLRLRLAAERRGIPVHVAAAPRQVARLLEITGAARIFRMHDSVETAMSTLDGERG